MYFLPSILLVATITSPLSNAAPPPPPPPCSVVAPTGKTLHAHFGRRVGHFLSSERFTVRAKSREYPRDRPLPNRLRFPRHQVFFRRRRRKSIRGRRSRHYPYGIVPFAFDPTMTSWQREIVRETMDVIQNSTCVRFVPRVLDSGQTAKLAYRLNHNGYIEFVNSVDCFCSSVGNVRRKTRVSCCYRGECLRLLGKALGQRIEHQKYRRDGFLRINPDLIPAGKRGRYLKASQWEGVDQLPLDLSSPMNEAYDTDGSTPVTVLTQDINRRTSLFYFFQEISISHQCHANNCSTFENVCLNDGYVTMIEGRCACSCPDGLDPETLCGTVLRGGSGGGGGDGNGNANSAWKCGHVYNLSEESPSVSISAHQGRNVTCTWLVNAPKGHTIVLDFDRFDIATRYGECDDWLEIRHARIGQPGHDHCGKENPRSVTSYFNRVMLRLFTSSDTEKEDASESERKKIKKENRKKKKKRKKVKRQIHSSFAVTARLVTSHNLCYNQSDKGYTYAGTVDYARDYSPCVPWWQMTHCQHNPYRFQDMNARLDNNYCRNPGNGLKPWCYVSPKGCQRKYCDVCMLEKPFNTLKDCFHLVNSTPQYCTNDKEMARATCAKECQKELFKPQPGVAEIKCRRPTVPIDGIQLDKRKQSQFSVGEHVTFRCRHVNRLYRTKVRKFCLSNGQWSHANSACLPCHLHKGWVLHHESCYALLVGKRSAEDHQMKCRRHGGNLVDIQNWEEQKFVSGLAFSKGVKNYFIGANDKYTENEFYFRDFSRVTWANWASENVNGRGIDCVIVNVEGIWLHEQCHRKYQAVCRAPILRHRRPFRNGCFDFRGDCREMAKLDDNMCERGDDGMFAVTQCAKTCGTC